MNRKLVEELQRIVGEDGICLEEPMSRHTTFGVGGPADVMIWPDEEELPQALHLCRQWGEPFCIIGNGSNLLVGDGGIRGVVIGLRRGHEVLRAEGDVLTAGAGVLLPRAAQFAAQHGLSGLEFAAGIPGTAGGAVVMNAGAYGGEMKDVIGSVTVLDTDGTRRHLTCAQLDLGYRRSSVQKQDCIVTEVRLKLVKGDPDAIRSRMEELTEKRREKQPLEYPSAGSTFKRPKGYFAGKLIMDAGLRGFRIGGAQISEKHCGFVINRGGATAQEIRTLMSEVSAKVERQFGVRLEPEVKMIGEF